MTHVQIACGDPGGPELFGYASAALKMIDSFVRVWLASRTLQQRVNSNRPATTRSRASAVARWKHG